MDSLLSNLPFLHFFTLLMHTTFYSFQQRRLPVYSCFLALFPFNYLFIYLSIYITPYFLLITVTLTFYSLSIFLSLRSLHILFYSQFITCSQQLLPPHSTTYFPSSCIPWYLVLFALSQSLFVFYFVFKRKYSNSLCNVFEYVSI